MKLISAILIATIFFGCATDKSDKGTSDKPETNTATETATNPAFNMDQVQTQQPGQVNVPAGADGKVYHYVCADGCEGGASDAAGTCAVCGKTLAHNQAFHAAPPVENNPAAPAIQPAQEPAQNALGVWHYTCPNGCAGGAGSQQPCPKCGSMLQHNSGYH